MLHPHLERQIKKHLGDSLPKEGDIIKLLTAISNTYHNYERDKELSEHVFALTESEYQEINNKLTTLTQNLEEKIKERTKELSDIAQFPRVNPNPILRVNFEGEILYRNDAAIQLKQYDFGGKKYTTEQFFKYIIKQVKDHGTFDVTTSGIQYLFNYKKIEETNYYNFYGTDVTEKNLLRINAQENYQRLRNFLETTDDAYYIIYEKNKEKNILTSRWVDFFGFTQFESKNIFADKCECVTSESAKTHLSRINKIKSGSKITIQYQVKNKVTGQEYWLSEVIGKHYDEQLKDNVISGKISDITKDHLYALQIKESEARFRKIMDAIPVMVWVSDENNKVTYSNQAMKKFLGFDLEKLRDYRHYSILVHPDDRRVAIEDWHKGVTQQKEITSDYRLKDNKGVYHYIFEKAVPRFLQDGKFAGYIGAHFDRTKEKEAAHNLRVEKEKLELLTRNSPDIIILTDENGLIEYISPTTKRILGFNEKEILHHPIQAFLCDECVPQLNNMNWLSLKPGENKKFEYRMKTKKNELIWVDSFYSLISSSDSNQNKILMHNRDINNVKRIENVLKESEQKYRGLFENMHLGIMEVDLNENIKWVNNSFEELTGYSIKNLKGKNAKDVFIKDIPEYDKVMKKITYERMSKTESLYEIKMKAKNGDLLDVVISGSPIIDINGNVKGSVGIHWNVTDIRKMEKMIEKEKTIRQNEVMKATLNAEEQQREFIGNELHDGVGHILTYTSLFLQMASDSEKANPQLFQKAHDNVEKAINEIRRISRNLVPPALFDLGLKEAIIELVNQYTDLKQIKFDINCKSVDFNDLEFELQRNIYRVVQELINNSVKHSNCSAIQLRFKRTSDNLSINYYDNGNGFNLSKVKKGLGLKSINNRVYFYEGTINISTSEKEGVKFEIHLPVVFYKKRQSIQTT
jgi:PAS domain S-box-containing protein